MITPGTNDDSNAQLDYTVSRTRAWFSFVMIFLLMMFDYIDRQI